MLFTGDIEESAEKELIKKYTDTNGEEKVENNFFLAKAYLFKLNQVERITPTN